MEQPAHFYNNQGEKLTGTLHLPDIPSGRGVVFGHCFTCSRHTGRVSFSSRGRSLQLSTGFFADAGKYNLPETIANLKTPLLIVHGEYDQIIPVQEAYLAQKLNRGNTTLAIFPGADHMFGPKESRLQVSESVVKWFKKHISEKARNTDDR
jgi:dienelactone hydrolase